MNARPLDFGFTPMSPLSHRPPWSIREEEQEEELRNEIRHRRDFYPMLVRQGRGMSPQEAEHHILVWDEIIADCCSYADRSPQIWAEHVSARRAERKLALVSWDAKVRELRRELAMRRNAYPRRIEANRLNKVDATLQMERLEAVHWRYWVDGFVWSDCLFDQPVGQRCAMFRNFEVPRIEWELAQIDAGARWARPVDPADRAWLTEHCRMWRADRRSTVQALDNAA
ncbi:hypothetical protein [Sphingomonas oligoaromativorans]|uniref:hypothetical protein n=1 Tax=Sphingomonas oligoaromativorans TaxID=575322 RepID=UPI00141D91BD|nr:hypothetical protein [Sphingomonas oligoaromativorans]NIJ34303.1 hypothetical protein [Sphingomonas oligoaromativorans]